MKHTILDGMMGLAVGDALGVPVEFCSRQERRDDPVTGMRAYGTHGQPAGTWSDDTSLNLALLASLAERGCVDFKDIMERFSAWLLYADYTAAGEVFDVGITTSRAIMNFGRGMKPTECGGMTERENGNGSLMRILPMACYLDAVNGPDMKQEIELVHQVSSLTHGHSVSQVGCGIYTMIARRLAGGGDSLRGAVGQGTREAFDYYRSVENGVVEVYKRLEDTGALETLPEEAISSSGYVVHTLEAALWCLLCTDSYRDCVLKAVNLGDDTDTVAAVAGGLAGLYYGAGAIPQQWLETLAARDMIERLCAVFTSAYGP